MYGPGAPKEIFSGRFTKLTEVSLFIADCHSAQDSPWISSLLMLPPCPCLSPSLFLSTSLVSCTVVHKFLGSISILSETVLVNPSCPGAWTLPPWRKLGNVSAHLICLPCLCAPWCTRSKICFVYFVQFSSCKVNSTFNCEKEVMVILGGVFTTVSFYDGRVCNNNLIINHTLFDTCRR